jgi:hypothetical protein
MECVVLESDEQAAALADDLNPPNGQAVALLPAADVQSSHEARTGGGVVRVYPDGLAFVDQLGAMRGYLSAGGLMALPLAIAMLIMGISNGWWLPLIMVVILLWLALLFIQVDWVGFRYEPVLLNRALGKVHVFKAMGLPWWQWGWKLWGRTRYEIDTYDWSCVRAEVVEFTIFTGQISRRESGLVFAITDVPGGRDVVQRFGVGPSFGYGDLQSPVQRWEHIRRFMRHEGPAWTLMDSLYEDWGVAFWPSFWVLQPLFDDRAVAWRQKGILAWMAGVGMLFFLPFTAYMGLVRYLSYRLKREPAWGKDILASLGGPALTHEQLSALALADAKAKPGKASKRRPRRQRSH